MDTKQGHCQPPPRDEHLATLTKDDFAGRFLSGWQMVVDVFSGKVNLRWSQIPLVMTVDQVAIRCLRLVLAFAGLSIQEPVDVVDRR